MTIPAVLLKQLRQSPDKNWLHVPEATNGVHVWKTHTCSEVEDFIAGILVRLYSLGVGSGTRVAICAETSAEWMLLDLAVLSLRGTVVGIYPTLPPEEIIHQINDSESEFLFVQNEKMGFRLEDLLEDCETLVHVFSLQPSEEYPQLMPAEPNTPLLEQKIAEVQSSDIATLVYTSGTTGRSKGVVLRHRHLISALRSSSDVFPLYSGDRSIVYLPLAHILQRFVAYRALIDDIEGTFAPSLDTLDETIRHTRPHVLVAVPRVLEKIIEKAASKAVEKGPFEAAVFRWAMRVAEQWGKGQGQYSRRITLQHRIASRLVYSKIHAGLGGHLRCILSGAAPLSPTLAAQFRGIGIQIVEGWGLTESSGPATLVHPNEYQLGSVGKALRSISLRISNDGEIQLQGDSLFDEYWNNPEATAAAFTADGWFRTGDLGICDAQGFVWITGRRKDIIVTAGGKNIVPHPIEDKLRFQTTHRAILVGDARPYLVCLFAPEENGLISDDKKQEIAEHVAKVNENLPRFSQIKNWAILDQSLTLENGFLTPTLKPKRTVIQAHFSDLINSLYAQDHFKRDGFDMMR